MNPHSHNPESPAGGLHAWKVQAPIDPGFRAAVWARIETTRRESSLRWGGYWRQHAVAWSAVFLLAISLSAVVGRKVGIEHKTAERAAILQTYLAAIDSGSMNR